MKPQAPKPFDDYDGIRQFRQVYEERLRRGERVDRIGRWLAFGFVWFWISFMSFGVIAAVEGYRPEPVSLRNGHDLLMAIAAMLFGGLATSLLAGVGTRHRRR